MPEPGFTRRSSYERELQPVAIVSVDPISRTAIGVTRTRHSLNINCAYATGDTITVPAAGEQWYCERFDMEWRLYGRIPFNDPTLNITPEVGQVSVGGAAGPLELNGTEARINAPVFRLGGVYYRDNGTALERSTDQITWTAIGVTAGVGGIVQMIAQSLTGFDGTDQTLALLSLENWAGILQNIIDNFSAFWNEFCQNVFVAGLKRMGFGETDLAKIVDGFQNFVNYLFGVIFCDFDGDLTPQTVLARIRDLLAPIINNPFVQGLQAIADILGVAIGNLLNDAVAGASNLIELIFDIITCNWDKLLDPETSLLGKIVQIIDLADGDGPFGPANIVKSIFNVFQLLGSPLIEVGGVSIPNPIGILVNFLGSVFDAVFPDVEGGNLLERALRGFIEFVSVVYGVLTCDDDAWDQAGLILDIPNLVAGAANTPVLKLILGTLTGVLRTIAQDELIPGSGIPNPVALFLSGLREFYEKSTGETATNLADGAIGGAVEFVRLIFRTLTCADPDVLNDFILLVDSLIPGDGTVAALPQEILIFLKDLLTAIIENPIVQAIRDFLTTFFPDLPPASLITQLLTGTTTLINWFLKIVTSIIPFDELWRDTLLPFIDWDAVDAVELPDLAAIFTNGLDDLWKILLKPLDVIVEGIFPTIQDGFTNFVQNIINLFSPLGGDGSPLSLFFEPGTTITDLVNNFLEYVVGIVTFDGGVMRFVEGLVPAVSNVIINLLGLFGIDATDFDVDPLAFDPLGFLATIAGKIAEAIFGFSATAVQLFFTRVTNLFGGEEFFTTGTFNPTAMVTHFIDNVLSLATASLRGLVEGVGSLVYNVAIWIIGAIRKIPFGVGDSIADLLQGLLDNFVNIVRGNVKSGSNLLADPGAEYTSFWAKQTAVAARDLTTKRSAGASLRVVSDAAGQTLWFNVNDLGDVSPLDTDAGEINYAECYVLYPTLVGLASNPGTSATVTLVAQYSDSTGTDPNTYELTATQTVSENQSAWVKLSGNFVTPSSGVGLYDRVSFGFRLAAGQSTSGATFFVDDMLVREVTETQGVRDAIYEGVYGTVPAPGTTKSTAVRDGVRGVSNLGRGAVQSGANLLADPKINVSSFWSATGLAVNTNQTYTRSTSQSLELTATSGTTRSFEFTVNDLAESDPLITVPDNVFYVECYVLVPTVNPTATTTITLFGKGVNLATGARSANITPTLPSGTSNALTNPTRSNTVWNKLSGYFKVPAGNDGFVAGISISASSSTPAHKCYIDDLLVQDVTGVFGTNTSLFGGPSPASTISTDAVPVLTGASGRTKIPELQATIDEFYAGVYGVAQTGNSSLTMRTAIQNLNQALFRSNSYPGATGTINYGAVPSMTADQGRTKILDIQTIINNVAQGFGFSINQQGATGSAAPGSAAVLEATRLAAEATAALSAAVTDLQNTDAVQANSGRSSYKSFSDLTGFTTVTGTGSSNVSISNNLLVWTNTVNSTRQAQSIYRGTLSSDGTYYSGSTATSYQKIGVAFATAPGADWLTNGNQAFNYILGRANEAGTAYVYVKFANNSFRVGYVNGGAETDFTLASGSWPFAHTFTPGAVYYLECGTSTGQTVYRVSRNGVPLLTLPATTAYSNWNSTSHRYGGWRVQATSNGLWTNPPGSLAAYAISDNTPGTAPGGFRRYYDGASGALSITANDSQTLPSGFFNQESYTSADYTYTSSAATPNKLTVNTSGWYEVKINLGLEINSMLVDMAPILYKNGSQVDKGASVWGVSTVGRGPSQCSDTFQIYLSKNDYIQPGYWQTTIYGPSGKFVGDSSGLTCYWQVSLLERSS